MGICVLTERIVGGRAAVIALLFLSLRRRRIKRILTVFKDLSLFETSNISHDCSFPEIIWEY